VSTLKFEDQKFPDHVGLQDYARLAEQFIPGRRAIFAIVEACFLELIPQGPAHILVVGAGGGEEIIRLGEGNPQWSFFGVDTYEPMVDLARQRLSEVPAGSRSRLQTGKIEELDVKDFDAATCILTAHFVPDDGSKLAFFEAIRARLKPGAPLALADGVGVSGEEETELLRRIWKRHAVRNGAPPDVAEVNAKNFEKVAIVSAARQEELLRTAGFQRLTPIFRGLVIQGWLAFA
jgi:tRNA (cmo5U34)-methyltransferase